MTRNDAKRIASAIAPFNSRHHHERGRLVAECITLNLARALDGPGFDRAGFLAAAGCVEPATEPARAQSAGAGRCGGAA